MFERFELTEAGGLRLRRGGCGHFLAEERPAEVAAALRTFLESS